ncbi:MAG: asparagine synthase (glutamine-hydrolyzing) [Coprobacillus sp.]
MCGIVGFTSTQNNNKIILDKMLNKIKHRGPDDAGGWIDDFITLGHRRLSIIDMAGGHQPMIDNHLIVVFNGEIYNYLELKKELEDKGYVFKTNSDTEVLLHGYKEYGYELVNYLRGMFAFVIYDQDTHELYCARDHFGIKPFYYYHYENEFIFGSEIKSFLEHPNFIKEFNEDVLFSYLRMGSVAGEDTFFRNVKHLLPGHYLIYKNNKIDIHQYYHVEFSQDYKSDEVKTKEIKETFIDSLNHHMIADVEIGSFLSSGIDSSYIVAQTRPKHTYTVEYEDQRYNESCYTKAFTDKIGIENKSIVISKDDYFKALKKVIYHLDEPTADPSATALYFVSQLASEDVKVVLSGEGADEIFGGYNTYRSEIDSSGYSRIPYFIRHCIALICCYLPDIKGKEFFIRNGFRIEDYYIGVNPIFSKKECKDMLKIKVDIHQSLTKTIVSQFKNYTNLQKRQAIDLQTWFVKDILQKGDKMTMAHSIEARVPFTDKDVFKSAHNLNDNQKVSKENTKLLLRESSHDVLPLENANKKKLGFPVPLREWIKDQDINNQISQSFQTSFINQYFNNKDLLKMLKDHQLGKHDYYKKIWAIYCLSLWHQTFFKEEYPNQ